MRRGWGRRLAPYLLIAPGGLWQAAFFVVPIVTIFFLSLQTGNIDYGFRQTWNFGIYAEAIGRYHTQFARSLNYATIVTVLGIAVGYPVAYWIAFRGGPRKNAFLLLLLLPYFVSFVIRTIAWQFILSDEGFLLGTLKAWRLVPQDYHVLSSTTAVIGGIFYNALPFMILPIYVALEKIDRALVEAAADLYADRLRAFLKVVLPLSIPGVFAGGLLTFIWSAGDYVNAEILGGPGTRLIGNIIQSSFLVQFDYPLSAALAFILMVGLLLGALAYAKVLGVRSIEEYV